MNYQSISGPTLWAFSAAPFRLLTTFCLLGILHVLLMSSAKAENSTELMATYGRGVHAYFNGRVHEADRLLTEVIHGGSTDPRAYYFRAMARLRAGRQYEAESDMLVGAAFEARNPGFGSTISRALERVQGPNRRKLEDIRRRARLDQLGEQRSLNQRRYEHLKMREPKVLRRQVEIPLERLTSPGASVEAVDNPNLKLEAPGESAQPDVVLPPDPFGDDDEPMDSLEEDDFGVDSGFEDDGDLFVASNTSRSSSSPGTLGEQDKVTPGTMVGIFGRIFSSFSPVQGLSMPTPGLPGMGPEAGGGFGAEDEFGAGDFGSDDFGSGDDFGAAEGFGDDMAEADAGDAFTSDSGDGFGESEGSPFGSDADEGFGSEDPGPSKETASEEDDVEDVFGGDDFAF